MISCVGYSGLFSTLIIEFVYDVQAIQYFEYYVCGQNILAFSALIIKSPLF